MELVTKEVLDWKAESSILRRGNVGEEVATLQALLDRQGLEPGPEDGIFGSRTDWAVVRFQQARCLDVDGLVGPLTRAELVSAWRSGWRLYDAYELHGVLVYGGVHPALGVLPSTRGRISHFGGPNDSGDRGYGQALVPVYPAKSVAALYEKYPKLVELGIFREGLTDPLPQTTCCGTEMQAGISWCLNPDSYYLAMRWARAGRPRPHRGHRVAVFHHDPQIDKTSTCIVAPTDWGPHTRTGRVADLSPGAMRAVGALTDDVCTYAWAANESALGPVE
jgi:peptidoglycan hydrolase-like protein with peptidoglycan-binding domain